jgi:hypothetical protein
MMLNTSDSLRTLQEIISRRERSVRPSVTLNRPRSADTALLIVEAVAPAWV